ncbi:MAG: hypothetical protein A3F13_07635 [Gammaproteobacteria bacterium RIFCSPHIGHO2_12_FULL_40_19]|nr:MAG: hypothetical protein A3F13_07635 [Gammaproteobacteria bacterium RIFCSPHIGHO2_12_FULL_40_19]
MQFTWVKQLRESSPVETHQSTVIGTFFINLLSLAFPLMLMQVYDRIIPNQSFNTLIFLSIGIIAALLIEIMLRIARSNINLWADTKYEYKLSKIAFDNLMNAPLYVYEETDAGTRIKQFGVLEQLRGFYNNQLYIAVCDIPFLLIFFIVIAYIGGILFMVPLIMCIVMGYFSFWYIKRWRNFLEDKLTHDARESDFIINVLSNIHTVKALGMEELLMRRYERLQQNGMIDNYHSCVQTGDLQTLKNFFNTITIILTATVGSLLVVQGAMAAGGLAACILLVGRVMQPLNNILSAFNRWSMLNIIREQLDSVLRMPVDKKERVSGFDELQGEIALRNVSFYFEDRGSPWILNDITLTIAPRMVVSIIGHDQTAKTALLNILATITKPTAGEYLLDGKNVDFFQTYEIREKIAYLTKTGKLFHGSMMENLSAFQDELIPTARRFADALGLNKIIAKLPGGYNTMVGDKAVECLPGGVINLILIIRALVTKPKIILLDEANMSLDTHSTQKMIELLNTLKEVSTIIILSCSADTLALSDAIYDLKNGKLCQEPYVK